MAFAGTAGATHGGPQPHTIKILRFSYYPSTIEVHPGDSIDVVNVDGQRHGVPHSVTSIKGYFDTGLFTDGTEVITAPDTKGRYKFYCQEHPFKIGRAHV